MDINDQRFKKLFSDKDYEIDFNSDKFKKKNKNLKLNDHEEIDETNKKLKEIEVEEDDIKNKKKKKEEDEERIVNKEIMKLNEKLVKKKKKRLDNFHRSNFDKVNNEEFGERMKNMDLEESDEEDFEIENKIRKLENQKEYKKNKANKEKEQEQLLKNKRVLASHNKLAKIKYK